MEFDDELRNSVFSVPLWWTKKICPAVFGGAS